MKKIADHGPPHVLQFIPGSIDDSINMIFVKKQVELLRAAGVRTTYVYLKDRQSFAGILEGCRVLSAAVRECKPDIVHAQYGTVTALVAAITKRCPLVITYRGSDLNPDATSSSIKMFAKKLMSQIAALRADGIITVSTQLKDKLWWRQRLVSVIPTGIDLDRFTPLDKAKARAELGWDMDERVVLLNVSRNPVNKRLDVGNEAVTRLREFVPGVRLNVLAGSTPPDLVPTIMSASDCLLMLSNHEGSPNVVKEAMACNLPVVSFDVGDVRERFDDVDGCTIVSRNMDDLVAAIGQTLKRDRRAQSREYVRPLSLGGITDRIVLVYQRILDGCA